MEEKKFKDLKIGDFLYAIEDNEIKEIEVFGIIKHGIIPGTQNATGFIFGEFSENSQKIEIKNGSYINSSFEYPSIKVDLEQTFQGKIFTSKGAATNSRYYSKELDLKKSEKEAIWYIRMIKKFTPKRKHKEIKDNLIEFVNSL